MVSEWIVTIGGESFFDTRVLSVAAVAAASGTGAGAVMREHQGALRSYAQGGGRLFLFATTPEIAAIAAEGSVSWMSGKWHHTVTRAGEVALVVSRRAGRTSLVSIDASAAGFEGRVVREGGDPDAVVVAGRVAVEQDVVRSGFGALLAGGKGRGTNEVILRVGELRQSFASPGQPALSGGDAAKLVLGALKEARKNKRAGES